MAVFTQSITGTQVLAAITSDTTKFKGADIATILTDTADIQPKIDSTLTTETNKIQEPYFIFDPAKHQNDLTLAGTWDFDLLNDYSSGVGIKNTTGADNDEYGLGCFYLPEAVAVTADVLYTQSTNKGIFDLIVDDSSAGTIDMYGATSFSTTDTISIGNLTKGLHGLRFKVSSKNASSSDHKLVIEGLVIRRT